MQMRETCVREEVRRIYSQMDAKPEQYTEWEHLMSTRFHKECIADAMGPASGLARAHASMWRVAA